MSAAGSGRAAPRVLLAEDSFLVAGMLRRMVEQMGCVVVGPIPDAAGALEAARRGEFDVAVLDLAIGEGTSIEAARAALARGKPVLFITGYSGAEVVPPDLRRLPRLIKPVDEEELRRALARAVGLPGRGS